MSDIEKIEAIQKYVGLNYSKISKMLGLQGPQIFYDIKSGRCGISKKLAQSLQKNLLINPVWLATGQGDMMLPGSVIGNQNIIASTIEQNATITNNVNTSGKPVTACDNNLNADISKLVGVIELQTNQFTKFQEQIDRLLGIIENFQNQE